MNRHPPSPIRNPHVFGFTLIEVLVALAITALIVGAASAAMMRGLRDERRAMELRDGALRVRSLAGRSLSGLDAEPGANAAVLNGWTAEVSESKVRIEDRERVWRIVRLRPPDPGGLPIRTAWLREPAPDADEER